MAKESQTPETFEFQAEVKQVLDIVVHSLYTDKEIFLRELVSNGSDALEKLRHHQLTEKNILDDNLPLEITISSDDTAGTITIQDFGIGMTREDLVENLGTIAHSGSKAFLKALKESGGNNENLIGQFGVGFYSAFMVASEVKVYTRHWKKDSEGLLWTSDGSGKYSIEPAEGQRRGTKIVLKLNDEAKQFAKSDEIKRILKRYSSFVGFPVAINGDKLSTVQAIWLQSKNDITEDQYKEFYKFQANAFDEPMLWMHFSSDAPIEINSLLYVPGSNPEQFGFGKTDPGVALHCRKVLIDSHPEGLLPDWLRFLRGVVDSADLPLNISRESMQDSALIQKINRVLTKRFIKFLEDTEKKDKASFEKVYQQFGNFFKEGVATDFTHREQLSKLLRFESSLGEPGELVSLPQYVGRMKEEQKGIYYLSGPSRQAIEAGPYLEAFKKRGLEVLFLYEGADEFVMNHLGEFDKKRLLSADADDLDLEKHDDEAGEKLSEDNLKALCEWAKTQLGEAVTEVRGSGRLHESPAVVLNTDKFMTPQMRRMMQSLKPGEAIDAPPVLFEVNPGHPIIKQLATFRESKPELADIALRQLFDNARLAAGVLEDPRDLIQRTYSLLEAVTQN